MAASTITRTGVTLTNDTGTPSAPVGDGTLLNNAWVQTFMDRIDALFSGALTIGGVLTAEGFGSHTFSASGTGSNAIAVRNPTAGTANAAALHLGNDSSATRGVVRMTSTTWTYSGGAQSDQVFIRSDGTGGIRLYANNAAGNVSIFTGGAIGYEPLRISQTAEVWVGYGMNTESAVLKLGHSRIGNGYAYLDLIGDTTYQTYGLRIIRANGGANTQSIVYHKGTGALQVITEEAAPLEFHTTNTKRAAVLSGGHLVLEELTTNPGTGDLTADAAVAVYTKADKLVFAYNNGGTVTYVTLDLDGSDTTWTHGTSAP